MQWAWQVSWKWLAQEHGALQLLAEAPSGLSLGKGHQAGSTRLWKEGQEKADGCCGVADAQLGEGKGFLRTRSICSMQHGLLGHQGLATLL